MLSRARAVGLLRSPAFAVFFGVSFIITIVLAFYYNFTGIYLGDSTLPQLPEHARKVLTVATVMTIGQWAELLILPFLPLFLRYMGMKWVLALGMLAWGVRYFLFALGAYGTVGPWVVIASLALHGVCFDFFFAAGFIYVDNEAPPEIRAQRTGALHVPYLRSGHVVGQHCFGLRRGLLQHHREQGDDLQLVRHLVGAERRRSRVAGPFCGLLPHAAAAAGRESRGDGPGAVGRFQSGTGAHGHRQPTAKGRRVLNRGEPAA